MYNYLGATTALLLSPFYNPNEITNRLASEFKIALYGGLISQNAAVSTLIYLLKRDLSCSNMVSSLEN